MNRTAAMIVSVCLAALFCGCSDGDDESGPKPPSYLKKYYQDDEADNSVQSGEQEKEEVTEEKTEKASEPEKTTEVGEDEAAHTVSAQEADPDGFPYGIWWANDGFGDSYYYFAPDGGTGTYFTQEDGLEVGFSYEIYGDTAVFEMNGADSRQADVQWLDAEELVLNWEDGRGERLVYYSPTEPSGFYYYNNSQLTALALSYFEMQNGWSPYYAEANIGAGGLIDIDLYDGGELIECYSVDRFSACGTDISGNYVMLD